MPIVRSEHILRQRPCGFLLGSCVCSKGSAVPNTLKTYSVSLSFVCGFCPERYGIYELDKDENGKPVKLLRKSKAYIDLAAEHTLSSPDTAFRIVNGAYEKMRKELTEKEIY